MGIAGYLDAQGRLWVCGRVSQRVKAAGGDLFPLQVEPLFDAHPKVRRSGLVGVPAPAGELPVLCVEVEPDVGKNELAGLRRELLALAADSERGEQDPCHPVQAQAAGGSAPQLQDRAPAPCQVGRPAVVGTPLPQPAHPPYRRILASPGRQFRHRGGHRRARRPGHTNYRWQHI